MAENKKHIINDENNYESVSILLSKEQYSIAFEKYVKDMKNGGMGVFGLSSDYVDNMASFVSPYNELENGKM